MEIITEASLKKKLIWDLLPHSRVMEMMPKVGIVPGSPEGEVMEHRASHYRIAGADPLEQMIVFMGALSGDILARSILESQGIEHDDEIVEAYAHVSIAACHAVIANLLDLNLIHLGGHS